MIEIREQVARMMSREQCLMHCMMILAELDRVDRLIGDANARCEASKDD